MSRERKFKVWHQGQMHEHGYTITMHGAVYKPDGFDNEEYCPDAVLIEWTGLKDIDGSEIYEGDLLDVDPDSRVLGEVILEDGSWRFSYPDWDQTLEKPRINERNACIVSKVGNRYENPDLLAGDKEAT